MAGVTTYKMQNKEKSATFSELFQQNPNNLRLAAYNATDAPVSYTHLDVYKRQEIKKLTGIPANKRLLLDITIGYPAKDKRKKSRKSKDKVVSYNHY